MNDREARQRLTRTTDGLGMHIDRGIMDVCVALVVAGFDTSGSCEGHRRWGFPYPWVEIYAPRPEGFPSQQAKAAWRAANAPHRKRMAFFLAEFHDGRATDRRLAMWDQGIYGGFRLQPADAESVRPEDLDAWRAEMNAFAAFLRSRN